MWPFTKKETHINIIINCEPLISPEKIKEWVEKDIIPILKEAAERNVEINIKTDDVEPDSET